MPRPRLLDLFCGAGGCARGYAAAGFDVYGIDTSSARLKHYPYPHTQADALEWAAAHGHMFDVIHASPPCQAYSITQHTHTVAHPDLLDPTRQLLRGLGVPYIIENVVGAPMPTAMLLCGTMFNLTTADHDGTPLYLKRHRLFESTLWLWPPDVCHCAAYDARGWLAAGVYGAGVTRPDLARERGRGYTPTAVIARQLMGIEDMPYKHLTQAIPPAYTQFIGEQLLDHLKAVA